MEESLIAFHSEAEAVQWLLTRVMTLEGRIISLEKENANLAATKDRMAALAARVSGLEAAQDELDLKVRGGHKSGKKSDLRKVRLAEILVSRNNQPMTFAEIGKVLELGSRSNGKNTREQNMTHFGKILEAAPKEFIVTQSKMGGRLVRLTKIYYDHLRD